MIDGAEEYRVEPGSRRDAGSQTNIFPVNAGRRSRCDDVQEILGAICGVHGGKMWNSDEPRAPSFILSSNRDDISSTSQRPIHQSWLSAYMYSRALLRYSSVVVNRQAIVGG